MWNKEWPTELGFYWAYGYFWKNKEKEVRFVKVKKISDSFSYISEGAFIYEKDKHEVIWQKINNPELPM